ncbi:hypothetical protein Tco_0900008 [Tanacetum coccineum]
MLALQAEEGEGSGNPSEPQPPPSTAQPTHEEPIPNIESSSPQKTQSPRQALNKDTELPQTSVPIPNVPDEAVHQERGDSVERAATTATSLEAVQDSSNIAKTQSTATPTELISQETGSDGGPRRQETIGVPLFKLDRVLALETDLRQTKKVYGTAYTKLIMKLKKLEKTLEFTLKVKEEEQLVLAVVELVLPTERVGYEAAIRLQEQLDEEESQRIARDAEHVSTFTSIEIEDKERQSELAAGSSQGPRAEHDEEHDEESVKKQKLEENDAEKEELKACLDIVSGDEIAIDFESLATKYLIIN